MAAIKVVLVEPQPIFLQGVLRDLEKEDDIEVCGTGESGADALALIQKYSPDVATVAIQLPDMSGLAVLEELGETVPVIFVTDQEVREVVFEAMNLGARGYLLKWYSDVTIAEAIRHVMAGHIAMGTRSLDLFVAAVRDQGNPGTVRRGDRLSPRELQIITLLSTGLNQRQISEELGLGFTTVRTHCRNAYLKLGVRSQTAAVAAAHRLGLIDNMERPSRSGVARTSRSSPGARGRRP